jgi:hypothetical protein
VNVAVQARVTAVPHNLIDDIPDLIKKKYTGVMDRRGAHRTELLLGHVPILISSFSSLSSLHQQRCLVPVFRRSRR